MTDNVDTPAKNVSDRAKIAAAAGIGGNVISRWLECKPVRMARKASDNNRFELEGPILPSDDMAFTKAGVGYTTPRMLREFLAERDGEDIEIAINSPGGSVFEATSMVSDLTRHTGSVKIVVMGACFSAATDFLTIPGARRVAMPGSMCMVHNAWTVCAGDSNELMAVAARLQKQNESIVDRMSKATGIEAGELQLMMDKETWFSESEALEVGLVDEVYGEDISGMDDESDDMSREATADAAINRGKHLIDDRLMVFL